MKNALKPGFGGILPACACVWAAVSCGAYAGDGDFDELLKQEEPPGFAVEQQAGESAKDRKPERGQPAAQPDPTESEKQARKLAELRAEIREVRGRIDNMSAARKREQVNVHYDRAWTYREQGKYDLALQEYLLALEFDPRDAGVHYNLGLLYEDDLKDNEQARRHYEKVIELAPGTEDAARAFEWLSSLH